MEKKYFFNPNSGGKPGSWVPADKIKGTLPTNIGLLYKTSKTENPKIRRFTVQLLLDDKPIEEPQKGEVYKGASSPTFLYAINETRRRASELLKAKKPEASELPRTSFLQIM